MDLPAAPGRFQASFPLDATPKKLALSYRPHSLVVICNTVENEGPLSNPLRGNESSARMGQDSDEEQVSPSTYAHAVQLFLFHCCLCGTFHLSRWQKVPPIQFSYCGDDQPNLSGKFS